MKNNRLFVSVGLAVAFLTSIAITVACCMISYFSWSDRQARVKEKELLSAHYSKRFECEYYNFLTDSFNGCKDIYYQIIKELKEDMREDGYNGAEIYAIWKQAYADAEKLHANVEKSLKGYHKIEEKKETEDAKIVLEISSSEEPN